MGATGSRSSSSPPTETFLVKTIPEYSKLLRVPAGRRKVGEILFLDLTWVLNLLPVRDDCLTVELELMPQQAGNRPVFLVGCGMSIEILDETGEHTVFRKESTRRTWEEGRLTLTVRERVLEASSCVRRRDESITIRCTIKEQQPKKGRRRLFGNWPSSKSEVALASSKSEVASHTLTVGRLSELKATLPSGCAYSTRFAVGGSSWYFVLYPTSTLLLLVRPANEDDETWTTAEFSFALQGAVNVQSGKMRRTFDVVNTFYEFKYQEPPPSASSTTTDRLVVRCCVQVIPVAVVVPTTAVVPGSRTKSELTIPLLSAMHAG